MTVIQEIIIKTVDMRVAIRTFMIGNSYTMVGKMFIETMRELKMKSKI